MAKNTSKFLNDIKNYDLIRDILRHIYLYGNYSKADIVKNNIIGSERSVYDMINRIKNYLGSEYLDIHKLPNRKKDKRGYRFKYDPFQCPINYLADSYRNCSYIIEDFIFYFTLLQSFNPYQNYNPYKKFKLLDYNKDSSELIIDGRYDYDTIIENLHGVLTSNEDILQIINQSICEDECPDVENLITPAKAKDRLKELVDLGILNYEDNSYWLAPDLFKEFDDILENLLLMVQFFYNFTELCIPGYYLANTLQQYMIVLGQYATNNIHFEQKNPVFFYKNCSLQNVIDDNVFWKLLCAIYEKSPIGFKYKNKLGVLCDYIVFPIKIVIERQYGRHYIFAYNYSYKSYITMRLDSISNIKRTIDISEIDVFSFLDNSEHNIDEQLSKIYTEQMIDVWNTTTSEQTYDVVIHFSFPESEYSKMYNRVKSTGRSGTIKKIDSSSFDYSVRTKSILDMKPWIRSFGANALVDKDICPELYKSIKKDYRKALESYGII